MIYRKDLCTYAEFKDSMNKAQRQEYLNKIYGDTAAHMVLAKIKDINRIVRDNLSIFIKIEITHFIFSDNIMQDFCLCCDVSMSSIGSVGFLDKNYRNFSNDYIINYFQQRNFSIGDKIICEICADSKYPLTFFITSMEKANISSLRGTYEEIGIPYSADTLFELRKEDKPNSLEILIYGDIEQKLKQLIDDKKSELAELEKQAAEIKSKNAQAESEYQKNLQAQAKNLRKEFERQQNNYNAEIANLNNEVQQIRNELKFLRAYGVSIENDNVDEEKNYSEEDLNDDLIYAHYEEWIFKLRDWLYTVYGLNYSINILGMVYLALQTNQLVLLVGEPGTGKTSLVRYLAKAFKFEDAAIIAVQSNWTDKSDLLGYYNPLEKNYVATPFLDALIKFSKQAERHPDKLYIICLDEMNLAHVEYYFAEFLSILQDTRCVRLYSDTLRQNILNELKHSGFVEEDGEILYEGTPIENLTLTARRYYFELCRLAQMLHNYPAEFTIPANVKFFGTLNQDETTLDISPKVLDRSFVIRLETYDAAQIFSENTKPVRYQPLEKSPPLYEDTKIADSFIAEMRKIAHISPRVINQFLNNNFQDYIAEDKFEDYIIAGCLLPKIRFSENEYADKIDALKNLCKNHSISRHILQEIDDGIEVDFWRRSR